MARFLNPLLKIGLVLIFLTGCGKVTGEVEQAPENVIINEQGLIVDKKIVNNQSYRFLVITNISEDELIKHSVEELVGEAKKEMSAAWYMVDEGTYDKLKLGQKVEVVSGNEQMESNPPIRSAKEVKILEDVK